MEVEKKGLVAVGSAEVSAGLIAPKEGAESTEPIQEIESRLRLGTLMRRARAAVGKSLEHVADVLSVSEAMLTQVENGNLTLSADRLQQFAALTGCHYEALIEASADFQKAIWNSETVFHMTEMTADARTMPGIPPEVRFVEYREGWFAGASGRDNPGDMSPVWSDGHEDGRTAMENAFHAKRLELDIHYGDGKAGAPE